MCTNLKLIIKKMIKILDCTLRDGGYYNNWKFDESLIEQYITAIVESNVDIVEIGFRFLPLNHDLGALAFSTDQYLNQLTLLNDIDVAVMINAKEFIESDLGVDTALNSVFSNKSDSVVDIVRIATHISDINECQLIASILRKLGYRVFLNLMQIDSIKSAVLSDVVTQIKEWGYIEVLYFADSFGNLNARSIGNIVETIKLVWEGEIGIHAHDNKGHALINSLSAIDLGVNYVDATILGMGRGAGNTKMENLLVEITGKSMGEYNPDVIFPLVLKEFSHLQEQYKWGSSIYYYLSAVHGIHPTYIQAMLGDGRYDTEQVLSAITFLKDNISSSYSLENMIKALSSSIGSEYGKWSAKDWTKGKEVLIIGPGPSIKLHIAEIIKYIEKNQPTVLCLNINQNIPENLVDAYIACHEARIAIELDLYVNLTKPIILPMSRMPSEIINILSNVDIMDYGLKIEKDSFSAQENGCILDKPLVLMYALSLLSVSGVKKISLTGVDGYKESNLKQQEMVSLFDQFISANRDLDLCAITPSAYPVSQKLIV
jgi:4-hydroxy 2-oxovalerate aldolase